MTHPLPMMEFFNLAVDQAAIGDNRGSNFAVCKILRRAGSHLCGCIPATHHRTGSLRFFRSIRAIFAS